MVVASGIRALMHIVWWSLILSYSLVAMVDDDDVSQNNNDVAHTEEMFEVMSIQNNEMAHDAIERTAYNEGLLSYLLSLPDITQIFDQLEDYAISFVKRSDCKELFAALPENIFKVIVRLHFYEQHEKLIDSVEIAEFYDRLEAAYQKKEKDDLEARENNGDFDFSELGLTTLDGFIDLLVLTNVLHPVKSLKFCGNKLRVLSESLKLLPSLKSFDVMSNEIRKLPNWIGELKQLERLNLAGNKLSELPDSIGDLENLTGLYLSSNWITQLPESFGRLRNLRGLYIKKSSINELPCSFAHLTKLEVLICDQAIKALLPYTIKQQLKHASENVVAHFERSGRPVKQLSQEYVTMRIELGPAYSEYI